MLTSLRYRLVMSHIFPSLIIIPMMGVLLIYMLESRELLPLLSKDLARDARLIANLTHDQPEIWNDPAYAQELIGQISPGFVERTMLLGPDGHLLASTDPADGELLTQEVNLPGITNVLNGQVIEQIDYSPSVKGEVIDVLAPVIGANLQVIGIVRLTYHFDTVYEELFKLRYLIVAILAFGLLCNTLLGFALALNIGRPIQKATQTIYDLAHGESREKLSEEGMDEIRKLSGAVNFLVQRLHNLEQARQQLLANLIHEIGRPLGALHSALQAILKGAYKDSQLLHDLVIGMDEETLQMQRLTGDLAHLHEQILGTLELRRQPVQLVEWLPQILRPWEEAAKVKGLQWELCIPPDIPSVYADPDRLEQIIGNLTSNALKYTPSGGKIIISANLENSDLRIQVSDTGPGILPEEQEKIFEPFYRGEQGRRTARGMGLGLTIAREIASAHGGRLEIESTPGLGSLFILWIPRSTNFQNN